MDVSGLPIDSQQLIEMAAVFGGLAASGVVGVLLVRRARAARLRQIEGASPEAIATQPRRVEAPREEETPEEAGDGPARLDPAAHEGRPAPGPSPTSFTAASLPAAVAPRERPTPSPRAPAPGAPAPAPPRGPPGQVIPFRKSAPEIAKPDLPAPRAVELDEESPRENKEPEKLEDKGKEKAKEKGKKDGSALAPGLARTRSGWISRLGELFTGKREIDPALLDEVEKVLLTADIGVRTSQKFLEEMRAALSRKELKDPASAWAYLRQRTTEVLSWDAAPVDWARGKPFVLLVIGVNGSGKTTTIGKLAAKFVAQGKKVIVGAGDTFRAAAAEQLAIWSDRVGATLVRGKEGADPSSVLFDAVKRARTEGFDVVIADTAGRLHTKTDLMEELQKIRRVIGKAADGAPHETWLVIDSTSGQNAIAQAQIFTQAMSVSGIVLTKLDGTAKGGVILGIADQLRIPVRFVGIGERVEDLREFDAEEFVEALYQ